MKKRNIMMTKKEPYPMCPLRQINLSLPTVEHDSYKIHYPNPPPQSRQPSSVRPASRVRPASHVKPLIDIHHIKPNNPTTINRSPSRFKHLTGPILINLFVDMPPVPTESSSTVADTISNALINSGYSGHTLRTLPSLVKQNSRPTIKDDSEQSQSSSSDRLLFDSVGSFEDPFISKTKKGMWHNVHHPQLTAMKVLHTRKKSRHLLHSSASYMRAPNTSSMGNLSLESFVSTNERLYEKVEQLTKNYFPSIQKLRHCHPCPELIHNRMHLHREEKRDFIPILFQPPVGR